MVDISVLWRLPGVAMARCECCVGTGLGPGTGAKGRGRLWRGVKAVTVVIPGPGIH